MQHITHLFLPTRKNDYHPHAVRHHGLLVAAILLMVAQLLPGSSTIGSGVLGFATDVTVSGLVSETNDERIANGLPALGNNAQLNAAAAAKAQHMIDNNYWAHIAPDGTTPWFFINQSGYAYIKAGENLAYGFSTSGGTVQGWMDSPPHRANILDSDYSEVGFGFANGANFQGNENTVVVAMYGQPPTPTPAPALEPESAAPTPVPIESSASVVTDTEADEPEPAEAAPEENTEEAAAAEDTEDPLRSQLLLNRLSENGDIVVNGNAPEPGESQQVTTQFDLVVRGEAEPGVYLSLGILGALGIIYFLRHLAALYHLFRRGEHYLEGHPLLEASLIYLLIWLILSGTYGAVL